MGNLINYFIRGYSLLIKNIDIYLIELVFSMLLIIYPLFLEKIPQGMIFLGVVLSFVIALFSFGYSFSIPLFFLHLHQGNKLTSTYIFRVTVRNSRRLLIPLLVALLGFMGLAILFGLIVILSGLQPEKFKIFVESLNSPRSLSYFMITTLIGIVLSFLNFTPIFFSIEDLGFFTATKKSILFAIRNIKFTLMIFIITLFLNFLTFLTDPQILDENNVILRLIQGSVFGAVYLAVLISSFLYYQDHKASISH